MVLRVSYRLPNATECFYRLSGCTTDRLEGLPAVRKSTSCYTIYRPPKSLQAVRAPKDHQGSTGNQSFIASYRPPVQTFEYLSNDLGEQCGYPKRLNGVKCRFWIPESRCTSSYYWLSSIEWCTYSVLPTVLCSIAIAWSSLSIVNLLLQIDRHNKVKPTSSFWASACSQMKADRQTHKSK